MRQEMQNSLALAGAVGCGADRSSDAGSDNAARAGPAGTQSGVASSGKLRAMRRWPWRSSSGFERDHSKNDAQLGEVQQAGREIWRATQTLQSILGGAKTRGTLGEVALERLLEDALPHSAYTRSTGSLPPERSWTPSCAAASACFRWTRNFRWRLMVGWWNPATKPGKNCYSRAKACGLHCGEIFLPDEHTFDYALMFVPSATSYCRAFAHRGFEIQMLTNTAAAGALFPFHPYVSCLPERLCDKPAGAEDRKAHAAYSRGHGRA